MTGFVLEWIAWGGYLGIFLLMTLENVFPPIPSEVIMGFGGLAVARGEMAFVPLLLCGTAGTVVGNLFWYEVGRRLGLDRFRPFVERYGRWLTLDWEEVQRIHRHFHERGELVIFVFRFLPNFRTMISLPAGMAGMPLWKFVLWTFAGSAVWNAILAGAGVLLGTRFRQLEDYLGPFAMGTMAVVVLVYVYRVVTWRKKR